MPNTFILRQEADEGPSKLDRKYKPHSGPFGRVRYRPICKANRGPPKTGPVVLSSRQQLPVTTKGVFHQCNSQLQTIHLHIRKAWHVATKPVNNWAGSVANIRPDRGGLEYGGRMNPLNNTSIELPRLVQGPKHQSENAVCETNTSHNSG